MRYTQLTKSDVAEMTAAIGVGSVDELFATIPQRLRLDRALDIPKGISELELQRDVEGLGRRNRSCRDQVCFMGAGAYDHFIPTLVDALAGQMEFVTAYTPYQAEASQGILQLFYEFQTMICELTGMDVANASLYEVSSATAEAVTMATTIKRRNRVLVADNVHPDTRCVLQTYARDRDQVIDSLPSVGGVVDPAALSQSLDDSVAAVVVQSPNLFGCVERLDTVIPRIHEHGALAIVITDPLMSGIVKPPGAFDADIVVGEGQCLGIPLGYGGPYLGLLAGREAFLRKMPGRIVGVAHDSEGRRGFCLVLQTREQHIKRQRATSNVCTNQGLLAIRAAVYMAAMGRRGIAEVARQCFDKAHYAAQRIAALESFEMAFDAPFFKEFAIRTTKDVGAVLRACRDQGILGGVALSRFGDQHEDCILVAVTEKRTKEEIDRLVDVLQGV